MPSSPSPFPISYHLIRIPSRVEEGSHALKSLAFHPYYLENGRIFVSFTCDSVNHPECAALVCGCNEGVGCTAEGVAKANPKGQFGMKLCRNVTTVVELSAGIQDVAKVRQWKRHPPRSPPRAPIHVCSGCSEGIGPIL